MKLTQRQPICITRLKKKESLYSGSTDIKTPTCKIDLLPYNFATGPSFSHSLQLNRSKEKNITVKPKSSLKGLSENRPADRNTMRVDKEKIWLQDDAR